MERVSDGNGSIWFPFVSDQKAIHARKGWKRGDSNEWEETSKVALQSLGEGL